MIGRDDPHDNIVLTVFVHNTRGGAIASKLIGHFLLKDQEFKFTAIAFGRIGGHNVSLGLSIKAKEKIRKMGLDPDNVQLAVQRKLIEGEVILPEGLKLRE
ncbi:MAG: hypothetical protein DLM72_09620 [Candidatus Nitrosopolaris wilkensis]|nr:MAG: hypothetical protein DLM72_09620 [Candidatus Nitrosopolaris wilkensis]